MCMQKIDLQSPPKVGVNTISYWVSNHFKIKFYKDTVVIAIGKQKESICIDVPFVSEFF